MKIKKSNKNKTFRGNASQFFVAGELCRRGLVAVVTLGNCPNTDVLCSNPEGTKFVHIQVKTYVPGNRTCSVGLKAEIDYGSNFFWVLGGIPLPNDDKEFEYYVIPSSEMAKNVSKAYKLWLSSPGRKGQKHKDNPVRTVYLPPFATANGWSIAKYKNRWDLIENLIKA